MTAMVRDARKKALRDSNIDVEEAEGGDGRSDRERWAKERCSCP
jgi:hypothetical protein